MDIDQIENRAVVSDQILITTQERDVLCRAFREYIELVSAAYKEGQEDFDWRRPNPFEIKGNPIEIRREKNCVWYRVEDS